MHRFSGKFRFSGNFEKFTATNFGPLALLKFNLVENFHEKSVVTNVYPKSVLHCTLRQTVIRIFITFETWHLEPVTPDSAADFHSS